MTVSQTAPTRPALRSRLLRPAHPALVLVVGLLCFAAGHLSLTVARVHPAVTTVWPVTGLALAAGLLFGLRVIPGVGLAGFAINYVQLGAPLPALLIGLGHMLEATVGTVLVERFVGGVRGVDSSRRGFLFSLLGCALPPLLGASVGVFALSLSPIPPHTPAPVFVEWWLGDFGGAHLLAPFILYLSQRPREYTWTFWRHTELGFLWCLLIVVLSAVFASPLGEGPAGYPMIFLTLPIAIWSAFRFTLREATLTVLLIAVGVIVGTLDGYGPFAEAGEQTSLRVVQVFLNVIALSVLPIGGGVQKWRAAEHALRAAQADLEARVEARTYALDEAERVARIGNWTWDVRTNAIRWSAELKRIFGRSAHEPDPTFEEYMALMSREDAALAQQNVQTCIESGASYVFEHRIDLADGTVRWVEGRGRPLYDETGVLVRLMGTGQDVTERKLAELEVRRLNEELERRIEIRTRELGRANAELESFNYSVSHDLRGPLRNIGGFAEILAEDLGGTASESARIHLERIVVNVRRMSDIISGMLALANAGRIEMQRHEIDLTRVAETVVAELRSQAPERVVRVVIDPAMTVVGDPGLMRALVTNLVGNAWKFTGRRVDRSAEIEIGIVCVDDAPEFFVRDNGAGFDGALAAQLFLPFRRLHQRTEFEGTGIGLATVARIAERMGGGVRATGKVGEGAAFWVRLPGLRGGELP